MAKRPLPTPKELRQLLRYDPETGKFFWLSRSPDQITAKTRRDQIGKSARWEKLKAGREAGSVNSRGYVMIQVENAMLLAHRVAWAMAYGSWPQRMIDHIDGDTQNNRITNLRDVWADNYKNIRMGTTNTSGIVGVRYDAARKKWRASVEHRGFRHNLGSFEDKEEAAKAVRRKREEIGGYTARHGIMA